MSEELHLPAGEIQQIRILYTGNLRGDVDTLARTATVVSSERQQSAFSFLVDLGDFAAGSPVADRFRGRPLIDIFNVMKYDAVLPGPAEFRWGRAGLEDLAEAAGFPLVAADLASSIPLVRPWTVCTRGMVRVGFLGLCGAGPDEMAVSPADEALRRHLPELRRQADLVVVLSRLGFEPDRRLAIAHPEIHAIIEGIAYAGFAEAARFGSAVVAPATPDSQVLGSLVLDFQGEWVVRSTKGAAAPREPGS